MQRYLELLKVWFKFQLTKTEFDNEARKFLHSKSAIQYHNKFMVALFSRCYKLSSTSMSSVDTINQEEPKRKKQKVKAKTKEGTIKMSLDNHHLSINFQKNFNELSKNNLNLLNDKRKLMFCSSEGILS